MATSNNPKISLLFYADTGTQYAFEPLMVDGVPDKAKFTRFANTDKEVKERLAKALRFQKLYPDHAAVMKQVCVRGGTGWKEVRAANLKGKGRFIRYRLGEQRVIADNGDSILLYGLWFALETNQGGNSRGTIIENILGKNLTQLECDEALKQREKPLPNVYMQGTMPFEMVMDFDCTWTQPVEEGQEPGDELSVTFNLRVGIENKNGDPIPVDLVLDLGNSRSVALLLEHGKNGVFTPDEFATNCKPLALRHSVWDHYLAGARPKDDCIIGSSLVLQTPRFEEGQVNKVGDARCEPIYLREWLYRPKQKSIFDKAGGYLKRFSGQAEAEEEEFEVERRLTRLPQMFVRLSPVLLGDEADQAMDRAGSFRKAGARFFQSSPKRYYWDLDQEICQTYWNMLPPPWESAQFRLEVPRLKCELLRFMPSDGSILKQLDVDDNAPQSAPVPNPNPPKFPRASSLTWMLLAMLERAWEQANTDTSNFRQKLLRNVIITYPSGWLPKEIAMYKQRCQEAVDIFAKTNFVESERAKVKLEMDIDEAVASQMPFVFTEISQIGSVGTWIELMGRQRNGRRSVNIMNMDIGGGTTDFSIINYSPIASHSGLALNIDLLYKDGFAVAGDDLLRLIIEKIILEGIVKAKEDIQELGTIIRKQFKDGSVADEVCLARSLHLKQVLIPLAIHLLALHNARMQTFVFSPEEAGVSPEKWNDFVAFLDPALQIPFTERFSFSDGLIGSFVKELFETKFEACAAYAAAYEADLLVISGKTSEIPEISQLIRELFPMPPDCIVPTKNYRAGRWYPKFSEDGDCNLIADAKTVTAVGAALQFALNKGIISGWTINIQNSFTNSRKDGTNTNNIWSILNDGAPRDANMLCSKHMNQFMKKHEDESHKLCVVKNRTSIYRQLRDDSHPEPVFMFKAKNRGDNSKSYQVTFKRVVDEYGGDSLALDTVYEFSLNGQENQERPNLVESFELVLCPTDNTSGTGTWQESGLVIR